MFLQVYKYFFCSKTYRRSNCFELNLALDHLATTLKFWKRIPLPLDNIKRCVQLNLD